MEEKKAERMAKMTASLKERDGVTHGYAEVISWMSVRPDDYRESLSLHP